MRGNCIDAGMRRSGSVAEIGLRLRSANYEELRLLCRASTSLSPGLGVGARSTLGWGAIGNHLLAQTNQWAERQSKPTTVPQPRSQGWLSEAEARTYLINEQQ